MARVTLQRSAARTLRRLDRATRKRVLEALQKLEDDPDRGDLDIAPLTSIGGCRLRIGAWRVLFDQDGDRIRVRDILPRGQAYRR